MKNQTLGEISRKTIAYLTIFSFMWSNCVWAMGPLQIIEEDFQASSSRTYVGKKVGIIDPGIQSENHIHNIFDTFQLPAGSGVVFKSKPDTQTIFNRFYSKAPVHLSGTIQSENLQSMVFANPGGLNLENPEFKNVSSLTLAAGGIAKTDQGVAYGVDQGAVSLHKTVFGEGSDLKTLALAGRTIQLSQSVLGVAERIDLTTGQHIGCLEGSEALRHPTTYVAEQADNALLDHSILIDPVTILRSRNIHFRSFDEGASIYSLGLLESTDEDIYIQSKGDIYLHNLISAKNLHIETTGKVFLGDQTWVEGKIKIKVKDIHIAKGLSAIGKTSLKASHSLNVQGNISSEEGISFKGNNSLRLGGTIAAKGKLKAQSQGNIQQEGFLYSATGLALKGDSFRKKGTILSEGSLDISTQGDIENQEGNINSLAKSSLISKNGRIINRGGITSEENILLDAVQSFNYGVVESQDVLTPGKNFFNQEKGYLKAKSLSNPVAVLTRNYGTIELKDDLTLTTKSAALRGKIHTQGILKVNGEKLIIKGEFSAQKGAHFNLEEFTNKGTFAAYGTGLQGKVGLWTNEGKLDFSRLASTINNTKNLENGVIRTKGHFILQGDNYENKGKVFTAGTHQTSLKGTYSDSGTFYAPTLFLLNAKDIKYLGGHTSYLKDGVISSASHISAGEKVAHYLRNDREKCFLQLNSQGNLEYKGVIKQTSSRFPLLDYYKVFGEESPVLYQELADDIYTLPQGSWDTVKPKASGIVLVAGGDIRCEKSTIDPESGSVSLISEKKLHTDKAKVKSGYFQGNNALAQAKTAFLKETILQSLFGTTALLIKDHLHLKNSEILGGRHTEVKAGSLKMDDSSVKSYNGRADIQVEKKATFNHSTVQGKTSVNILSRKAKVNNIEVQSEGKSSFKTEKAAKIKAMTLSGQSTVLDVGKNLTLSMSELTGEYNQVNAQNIKSDSLSTQGVTLMKAQEKCNLKEIDSQGTFIARAKELSLSHNINGENLDIEGDHLKNTDDVHAVNLRMKGKTFEQLGTTQSKGSSHLEATENYIDTKTSRNEAVGDLDLIAENNRDFQGFQKADVLDIKLRDMNLLKLLNQAEARVTNAHLKEGDVKIDEDLSLKTNLHLWAKKLENKAKLTGNDFIAHIETTILNKGAMDFHGKAFLKATQGITNTETGNISATQGLGFETEGTFTHKGNATSENGLLSVKAKRIDADAEVHTSYEATSPNTSTRKARFVLPSFSGKNVHLESETSLNLRGTQVSAQEDMDLIAKEDIRLGAIAYAEGDQEITFNLTPNLKLTATTDPTNKYLQGALKAGGNIRAKTAGQLDGRGLKANAGGSIVLQADQGVDLSSLAAVSVVERWNYNTGLFGQNNHRGFREDAEFYKTDLNSQGGGIYVLTKEGGITARGTSFQAQDEVRLDARDKVDVGSLKATVRHESHDEDQFLCFGSSDDKSGSTERFRQMQALSNKKIGIFSRQGTIEGDAPFMKAPEIELDGEKGIFFKPLEIHSQEDTHHYENNLILNPDNIEFEHKEKHTHTKSMQQIAGTLQADHLKLRTGQGAKALLTADVSGLTQEAADITADTDELAFSGIKSTYDSTTDAWSVKVSMSVNMTPGAGFDVSHEKLHKTNYGATVQKFGTFHNKRKGAILHVEGGAQTSINETTGEDMEAIVDKNAQNKESQEGYEFGASASSTGASAHFSAKGGEKIDGDKTTGLNIKKQTNKVNRKDIEHETKDTRWGFGAGVTVDQNGKVGVNAQVEVAGRKIGGDIPTDQENLKKLNPVESLKSMEIPKDLESLNKVTQDAVNLNHTLNDLGINTGPAGDAINVVLHQNLILG